MLKHFDSRRDLIKQTNHIGGIMVGMLAVDRWFVCQTKIL